MTGPEPAEAAQVTSLLVEDQLCFALYSASRAFTGRYRTALAATGLTYSQYLVMLVLWEQDRARPDRADGTDRRGRTHQADAAGISLTALSDQLDLDSGTLSPMLKRLERLGLLTRRRAGTDERLLEIACTPTGRALYAEAATAQAAVVEATGLTPAELAHLRDIVRAVTHRMRERAPAPEHVVRAG